MKKVTSRYGVVQKKAGVAAVAATGLCLLCSFLFFCGTGPRVTFVEKEDRIDVLYGEKHFATYVYGADLGKPILYPLYSPSGVFMTRHVPPDVSKGENEDHPHHTGVYFTYEINREDNFWAVTGPGTPRIDHVRAETDEKSGTMLAEMHWIGKSGQTLLIENRKMVFRPGTSANEIDFTITLTATDTTVVFHDSKEGMFAVRVAGWMREIDSGGTATYTSSNGDTTEEGVWGKRAKWMKLDGKTVDKSYGIAILNHPQSVNYPTFWHARGYGLFAANPLGQSVFQSSHGENPEVLDLTLEPGESAQFKFLLIVYEGERSVDEMEEIFSQYAQ